MSEDEVRRRIARLGPEGLDSLAERLGVLRAGSGGPAPQPPKGEVPTAAPDPAPAPHARSDRGPQLDFPDQDVDALLEQLLERAKTAPEGVHQAPPADVRRPQTPPLPDEREHLRELQTDAMLATLFLLEEEGVSLKLKGATPGTHRGPKATSLHEDVEQLGSFVRALRMRPGTEEPWRDFVGAVAQVWQRRPPGELTPAAVARIGIMLFLAGVFGEAEGGDAVDQRGNGHAVSAPARR